MNSWKARIGKVSPSRGDNYIYEFYQIVPKDILLTTIATTVKRLQSEDFSRAFDAYEQAALTLAEEGVQMVILGGGPVFVSQGAGSEEALCSRIKKATSLPVTTEFASAADACTALKIKRLAIISPYREELNRLITNYFQEKGFQDPLARGLGISRNIEIAQLPEDAAYKLTLKALQEDSKIDGFYITCPRWRTSSSIAKLEKETGKPVVSTVQSTIWSAFRILSIKEPIQGYGRLLSSTDLEFDLSRK